MMVGDAQLLELNMMVKLYFMHVNDAESWLMLVNHGQSWLMVNSGCIVPNDGKQMAKFVLTMVGLPTLNADFENWQLILLENA